ncbi:hypothetical protein [Angelakisella massiliensis]|uniref:hypothetical protein n=1 Tax=Angelakisella massiliensis TaxID=1871018 RepID=UPI0024B0D3C2|nr:hypothetical protein [Angelakisella massiliensis]
MNGKEMARKHKKLILAGILCCSIVVDGGFFPMVNFNPQNPVDLGIPHRLLVVMGALWFHQAVGCLEAAVFPKWSGGRIAVFNVFLVVLGLICRYLLEFGEVSNSYNFTVRNVFFQVTLLALMSTAVCLFERRKS